MEDLKNNTITSKRMNQRDTRRGETTRQFWKDFRKMNCSEILNSPSDGLKNIVSVWIRSCSLISHIQLRGQSVSDMNTTILLAPMVKDQSQDREEKNRLPASGKQSSGHAKTSGEPKSVYPPTFTIPTATGRRTSKIGTGDVGDGQVGPKLLLLPHHRLGGLLLLRNQPGGRQKIGRNHN